MSPPVAVWPPFVRSAAAAPMRPPLVSPGTGPLMSCRSILAGSSICSGSTVSLPVMTSFGIPSLGAECPAAPYAVARSLTLEDLCGSCLWPHLTEDTADQEDQSHQPIPFTKYNQKKHFSNQ
ncbi:unnamed protein product [Trichogramma brassicae]|uniref:Uncharacterized protein n=1 Tax=Trichogramma brassicae TaxID=86971 RepID=A0A6H5IXR3_9HYME|nr:unnamed protein product [Trichogramma brassicae]